MNAQELTKKEKIALLLKKHEEVSSKACDVISKSNGHLKKALSPIQVLTPKKF